MRYESLCKIMVEKSSKLLINNINSWKDFILSPLLFKRLGFKLNSLLIVIISKIEIVNIYPSQLFCLHCKIVNRAYFNELACNNWMSQVDLQEILRNYNEIICNLSRKNYNFKIQFKIRNRSTFKCLLKTTLWES